MCYVSPEDVSERKEQIQMMYGSGYKIDVGRPEDFASRQFVYNSLEAFLEVMSPERKRYREYNEQQELTKHPTRKKYENKSKQLEIGTFSTHETHDSKSTADEMSRNQVNRLVPIVVI